MTDLIQLAGTQQYFVPVAREHQERNQRFLAEMRRGTAGESAKPQRRLALVPRLAGALGLF